MSLSLFDAIKKPDIAPVKVHCPEWEADCYVLPMGGDDRDWWDQLTREKRWPIDDRGNPMEPNWRGLRAALVAHQWCDEHGEREPYTDADVLALGKKNGAAIDRLFSKIQELSGLLPGAVEDEEKN